jgi:hypothetical protein
VWHESAGGIELDGMVVAQVDRQDLRLNYRIRCDPDWTTRGLVVARSGVGTDLVFESDGAGRWIDRGGAPLDALAGCIDVDIAVTPSTNTLPIRRLPWQAGQSRDLRMVYLAVPEMTARPAPQRYTCLESSSGGSVFRYESGTFRADLQVDPDGLVVEYPALWRRIGH